MLLNAMDQQMAFDYIVYMMVGSYFKRARLTSLVREQKLRLLYLLLGNKRQVELEQEAEDDFLDRELGKLPADFMNRDTKVLWSRDRRDVTKVSFINAAGILEVASMFGGKNYRRPRIRYHFLPGKEVAA